jgi:hypothetical protein
MYVISILYRVYTSPNASTRAPPSTLCLDKPRRRAQRPELHNAPRRTMPTLRGEVKPELDDDNPYVTSSSHSRASRSTSLAPRDALEPPLTTTAAGGCPLVLFQRAQRRGDDSSVL